MLAKVVTGLDGAFSGPIHLSSVYPCTPCAVWTSVEAATHLWIQPMYKHSSSTKMKISNGLWFTNSSPGPQAATIKSQLQSWEKLAWSFISKTKVKTPCSQTKFKTQSLGHTRTFPHVLFLPHHLIPCLCIHFMTQYACQMLRSKRSPHVQILPTPKGTEGTGLNPGSRGWAFPLSSLLLSPLRSKFLLLAKEAWVLFRAVNFKKWLVLSLTNENMPSELSRSLFIV